MLDTVTLASNRDAMNFKSGMLDQNRSVKCFSFGRNAEVLEIGLMNRERK